MSKNVKFLLLGLLFFVFTISAQDFGDISDEELAMIGIKEDPNADAVILFDKGEIIITPDWDTVFKKHTRIKILTEKGKEYANIEIPFWHENQIDELEAQAYLPNGDEFELDDDNVFEEGTEKLKMLKFAIPGVEVGSVIEYKYELFSEYIGFLRPWYFQSSEFTKRSELKVFKPKGFSYNAFKSNTDMHKIEFIEGEEWNPYRMGQKIQTYKWVITDIPGIKKEPYMFNLKDHMARITFQIAGFQSQYGKRTYLKSWEDIAKEIRDSYDHKISDDGDVEEVVQSIITGIKNKEKIIQKLYDYVRSEISTDDKPGFRSKDLFSADETLEEKKGNKVEKNLLLISMLKNAEFESYPVIISTKNYGSFNPNLMDLDQFNHCIVCVVLNKKKIFLDTRDKYCPLGILPITSSVSKGFLVNEDKGQVVPIKLPPARNDHEVETNVTMQIDGLVNTEMKIKCDGYVAMGERKKIDKEDETKDYIKDLIDDIHENAVLDTFTISNLDSIYKPLEMSITFNIPEYAQIIENMIYFSPVLLTKLNDNPFKKEKRLFPVDYSYTVSLSEISKIVLPEVFKISELPKKTKTSIKKISFISLMLKSDNTIEITRNYRRRKTSVSPYEYKDLKKMYDKMLEADESQIVLEKI